MIRPPGSRIAAWVDPGPDTGHGLAAEICREVFDVRGVDPYHYAVQDGEVLGVSIDGMVLVPVHIEQKVVEAASEQPEENIHLHYVQVLGGVIIGIYLLDGTVEPWVRKPGIIPDGVN